MCLVSARKWYRILRVPWEHPHTAVPYDPEYQSSYSKRDSSPPVLAFAEIPRQYARAALSTVPPRPVQCKSHRKYGNMLHLLLHPYNIFSVLQTVSKALPEFLGYFSITAGKRLLPRCSVDLPSVAVIFQNGDFR